MRGRLAVRDAHGHDRRMDCDIRHRRILLTGASGLVGAELKRRLVQCGIGVVELSHRARPGAIVWDGSTGTPPRAEAFDGVSAVIHLAGAPIERRWSESVKQEIRNSRVNTTRALVAGMSALPKEKRPEVFICMSGAGIYGTARPEMRIAENAPLAAPGESFLADVARDWEKEAGAAENLGVRTVMLRTGMVLARQGGALPKMALPFKFFLGGRIGSGRQHSPWISLDDLTSLMFFALRQKSLSGAVNAVAPHCVTNSDFTKALSVTLHRPAILPTPACLLRLVFGNMAQETLLADSAPFPAKAMEAGFEFKHHEVTDALAAIYGPPEHQRAV